MKRVDYAMVVVLVVVGLGIGVALRAASQQPAADPQAQQIQALRAALAQSESKLSDCNGALAPLQKLESQVISGEVQNVSSTIAEVKAAIARKNKGKIVGDDYSIQDAPAETKTAAP